MSNSIIEVKNLGKKYTINHHRGKYIALRDILTNIIKNPFSFLKKKAREIAGIDTKEDFWALKDVSFNIEPGEVVGIIGRNGAGKSTLLKILTGITPPTTGEIKMKGKVASLLEVGTGFHPELTGRENIFLNGAILGMTKKEIVRKFDEIIAFAGIEKFLDTPVKYYSSGMYVRLAFSVAAHMEPDILLVDEVLAVGDAEFQKKCLGKMEEVTKKSGRTILFVSHNMGAIQNLCKKTILLEKGRIKMFGETSKVIDFYLNKGDIHSISEFQADKSKEAHVSRISIQDKDSKPSARLMISEPFSIKLNFDVLREIEGATTSFLFYSNGELLLISSESDKTGKMEKYKPGSYESVISIPAFLFNVGMYFFDVRIHAPGRVMMDHKQNIPFEILSSVNDNRSKVHGGSVGKIASVLNFKTTKKT